MLNTNYQTESLLNEPTRPLSLAFHFCFWPLMSLGLCLAALTLPRAAHTFIYPTGLLSVFQNLIHISGFLLLSGRF